MKSLRHHKAQNKQSTMIPLILVPWSLGCVAMGLTRIQHISRPHSECANSVGFGNFTSFSALFAQCAKMLFLGGGGGMCILFEICVKRPFQKYRVGGGVGIHIFEHIARN